MYILGKDTSFHVLGVPTESLLLSSAVITDVELASTPGLLWGPTHMGRRVQSQGLRHVLHPEVTRRPSGPRMPQCWAGTVGSVWA